MLVQPIDDAYISVGSKAGLFLHHEEDDCYGKIVAARREREEVEDNEYYDRSALAGDKETLLLSPQTGRDKIGLTISTESEERRQLVLSLVTSPVTSLLHFHSMSHPATPEVRATGTRSRAGIVYPSPTPNKDKTWCQSKMR